MLFGKEDFSKEVFLKDADDLREEYFAGACSGICSGGGGSPSFVIAMDIYQVSFEIDEVSSLEGEELVLSFKVIGYHVYVGALGNDFSYGEGSIWGEGPVIESVGLFCLD